MIEFQKVLFKFELFLKKLIFIIKNYIIRTQILHTKNIIKHHISILTLCLKQKR